MRRRAGSGRGLTDWVASRRLLLFHAALGLAVAACGQGDMLQVGRDQPELKLLPGFEGGGSRPRFLNTAFDESDPTLTGDMLQIFFASNRPIPDGMLQADEGDENVWCAERESREEPFGSPKFVLAANSPETEASPAVSIDGLTLWVGSARAHDSFVPGDSDIWRISRPALPDGRRPRCDEGWAQPQLENTLNSSDKDIPRPLGWNNRVMPLGSRRKDGKVYLTYFAARNGQNGDFGRPRLGGLDGLAVHGAMVDAFLSDDGRLLFFKNEDERFEDEPVQGDLQIAWRRSVHEPFSGPLPLDALNTSADERDPWLNPEADRLFFVRQQLDGSYDILAAHVQLDTFQ